MDDSPILPLDEVEEAKGKNNPLQPIRGGYKDSEGEDLESIINNFLRKVDKKDNWFIAVNDLKMYDWIILVEPLMLQDKGN